MIDFTKDQEIEIVAKWGAAREENLIKMPEEKEFFLFQDRFDDEFPDAYFIIPSELGYPIFHQYGCTGCYHFKITGFAVPVPDPQIAKRLEEFLGCDVQCRSDQETIEIVKTFTGLEIEHIQSEALARLKNGWYVATCNCD